MVTAPPKRQAGNPVIALDTTITGLRAHHARQRVERGIAGTRWHDTGYVFTTVLGMPVGPDRMTRIFRQLVTDSGLPPVTLHGRRHGTATPALTADTYTSVLPETARTAADKTAALLFPARPRPSTIRKPVASRARKHPLPPWARPDHLRNHHAA
jgi:integrase